MIDNELKKLKRKDLLVLLLEQQTRIEELEKELVKANEELDSRKIMFKELGNLAESALKLSGIFEKADEAAQIYLKNIELYGKRQEQQIKKEHRELKKKLEGKIKINKKEVVKEKKNTKKINVNKKGN